MTRNQKYDVFVSHAVEDKHSVTNELTSRLKTAGLSVWYSSEGLGLGSSIVESVNAGMVGSEYSIVVLSPMYLEAKWALIELEALFALESTGKMTILPLWHEITLEQVLRSNPLLAGRFGLSTSTDWDELVPKIVTAIRGGTQSRERDENEFQANNTRPDNSQYGSNFVSNSGLVAFGGSVSINAQYAAGNDMHLTVGK
jgi:hypothetical protein